MYLFINTHEFESIISSLRIEVLSTDGFYEISQVNYESVQLK